MLYDSCYNYNEKQRKAFVWVGEIQTDLRKIIVNFGPWVKRASLSHSPSSLSFSLPSSASHLYPSDTSGTWLQHLEVLIILLSNTPWSTSPSFNTSRDDVPSLSVLLSGIPRTKDKAVKEAKCRLSGFRHSCQSSGFPQTSVLSTVTVSRSASRGLDPAVGGSSSSFSLNSVFALERAASYPAAGVFLIMVWFHLPSSSCLPCISCIETQPTWYLSALFLKFLGFSFCQTTVMVVSPDLCLAWSPARLSPEL